MKKSITLNLTGMHCPSCDIMIKNTLENYDTSLSVEPNFKNNSVKIYYSGNTPSPQDINNAICEYGYCVKNIPTPRENYPNLLYFISLLIIFFGIYFITTEFTSINLTKDLQVTNFSTAFIIGIIASLSTCMATSGAILLTLVRKQISLNFWQRSKNVVLFLFGRVGSYAFFGFLSGYVGRGLIGANLSNYLQITISVLLLYFGLQIAGVLPKKLLTPMRTQNKVFNFFDKFYSKYGSIGTFFLGFATYFLACGFTWSVQSIALELGNPLQSMLLMTGFALGTIPMLALVGFGSNKISSKFNQVINLISGALVVFFALYQLASSFLTYYPLAHFPKDNINTYLPQIVNGKQILKMSVSSVGYSPTKLQVKNQIPVSWEVLGEDILGCQGTFQAPKAGIALTQLRQGLNKFEFTPREKGIIAFSCSMGMYRGEIEVI